MKSVGKRVRLRLTACTSALVDTPYSSAKLASSITRCVLSVRMRLSITDCRGGSICKCGIMHRA